MISRRQTGHWHAIHRPAQCRFLSATRPHFQSGFWHTPRQGTRSHPRSATSLLCWRILGAAFHGAALQSSSSRSYGTGSAVQPFSYADREAHTNASRSWPHQEHHAASGLASTFSTRIATALGVLHGDPRTVPRRSCLHDSFWVPPLAFHQTADRIDFAPYSTPSKGSSSVESHCTLESLVRRIAQKK